MAGSSEMANKVHFSSGRPAHGVQLQKANKQFGNQSASVSLPPRKESYLGEYQTLKLD